MDYNLLPDTDIKVSKICLGTMTWGRQNTEAEGHEQMDYAVEQGVNFFDVAELYPVPADAQTQGETERIIGTWFNKQAIETKSSWPPKSLGQVIIPNTSAKTSALTKPISTRPSTRASKDYKPIISTSISCTGPKEKPIPLG